MSKQALEIVSNWQLTEELKQQVYLLYPRRGDGKKKGMIILDHICQDEQTYRRILTATKNYAEYVKLEDRERKHIKMWSTFLNNWEDYEDAKELGINKLSPFEVF